MKDVLGFLKSKVVIAALLVAVVYQAIMMGIFLPGYSAMPDRMDKITVNIVNEDAQAGKMITEKLAKELDFKVDTDKDLKEARKALNNQKTYLIIHIPEDFTKDIKSPKDKARIDFEVSEANPLLINSAMKNVASGIEKSLDQSLGQEMNEKILKNFKVPSSQAKEMSKVLSDKIDGNVIAVNKLPNQEMQNAMGPLFISIATCVGAMIFSMLVGGEFNKQRVNMSRLKSFISLELIVAIASIIVPTVGLGIYFKLENYGFESFMQMWGMHALLFFAASHINLIFNILLNELGMIFNLPFLLTQVISGGGVLPRAIMYPIFQKISIISPIYYSIKGDFGILFGGPDISSQAWYLAALAGGAIAVILLIHMLKPLVPPKQITL
ncbi:ABC transporter permease [Macrococcus capreoli]